MIKMGVDGTTQPVAKWEGTAVEDKLQGVGSEQWSNGVEYRGDFLDNMRHGHGRMLQRDGTVYEGQWYEGKAMGYGILIQADGFKHYGLFKDNVMVQEFDLKRWHQHRVNEQKAKKKQKLQKSGSPSRAAAKRCQSA